MVAAAKRGALKEDIMIPYSMIGLIFAIILQSMGAVWWSSGVNVKLDYLQKSQTELATQLTTASQNKYTSLDAARDWANNDKRAELDELTVKALSDKIDIDDKRITILETEHGRRN